MGDPDQEEFSFPATAHSPPHFIDSPPLWRMASASDGVFSVEEEECDRRKSLSHQHLEEEEDKMDVLWEEFMNDEERSGNGDGGCGIAPKSDSDDIPVDFGCVQALNVLKHGGGAVFSGQKPNVVAFVKVLKKLFLLHNSRRRIKKRSL